MRWFSPVMVRKECVWQKPGGIHQESFKLTPQRRGDNQNRDSKEEGHKTEAHL